MFFLEMQHLQACHPCNYRATHVTLTGGCKDTMASPCHRGPPILSKSANERGCRTPTRAEIHQSPDCAVDALRPCDLHDGRSDQCPLPGQFWNLLGIAPEVWQHKRRSEAGAQDNGSQSDPVSDSQMSNGLGFPISVRSDGAHQLVRPPVRTHCLLLAALVSAGGHQSRAPFISSSRHISS